jgi:hypothetical protein
MPVNSTPMYLNQGQTVYQGNGPVYTQSVPSGYTQTIAYKRPM